MAGGKGRPERRVHTGAGTGLRQARRCRLCTRTSTGRLLVAQVQIRAAKKRLVHAANIQCGVSEYLYSALGLGTKKQDEEQGETIPRQSHMPWMLITVMSKCTALVQNGMASAGGNDSAGFA